MVAEVAEQQRTEGRVVETLADLLPLAAQRFADRVAVVGVDRRWTFAEVDRSAGAVAAYVRSMGVEPGQFVVVAMHKTADSFILMHGLLRAGAVMVPIDPLMPAASMRTLIGSVQPAALVVDHPSFQRLDPFADDVADLPVGVFSPDIDDDRVLSLRCLIDDPPSIIGDEHADVQADDAAYVIFTSGSTGEPKGITHTHRSALAYARQAASAHRITTQDCLAGLPPLHFDMSTLELYAAPLVGASIVPIGTAELRFPASFTERSATEGITVWYAVPFQLRQISERGAIDQRDLSALRQVIYAGEPFPVSALSQLMTQLPNVRFSNAYGPAESNVVTVHELASAPDGVVPIGRPWVGVEIRVVESDKAVHDSTDLAEVATGELGELWVKAETLMEGYLGRPDLTTERMIGPPDDRWYRTGDLVRRDHDGVLWLAGRLDHQVKVRGVRLELEAIEAVMSGHPQVAEAVAALDRSGSEAEALQAAVTLAGGVDELDRRSLRRWCLERLPQVAVPVDVHVWDGFPETSSGKVDKKQVRADLDPFATDEGLDG